MNSSVEDLNLHVDGAGKAGDSHSGSETGLPTSLSTLDQPQAEGKATSKLLFIGIGSVAIVCSLCIVVGLLVLYAFGQAESFLTKPKSTLALFAQPWTSEPTISPLPTETQLVPFTLTLSRIVLLFFRWAAE